LNDIDVKFEYEEYAIQGKMIVARITVPSGAMVAGMSEQERQEIRTSLTKQIAGFMLDNSMLEFVTQKDPYSLNDMVAARCFVVPNGDVRLIRALKR